ncbi:hypothetical protein GCM10015536_25620 [Streptomyces griseomycini]|nr:hypothetical protein GCM10015536_25620 [Streptomyces griseomycini]
MGAVCSRDQVVTAMVVMSEREPPGTESCRTPARSAGRPARHVPVREALQSRERSTEASGRANSVRPDWDQTSPVPCQ